MPTKTNLIVLEQIEPLIKTVRGQKVILDNDLARLYGVTTKRLNEQVRRNIDRFPDDFLFQLTEDEGESLRSQIATLNAAGIGRSQHRKYLTYAFTEHGAIMAATILSSPRAIEVSVYVVRAFVRMRELAATCYDRHCPRGNRLLCFALFVGDGGCGPGAQRAGW